MLPRYPRRLPMLAALWILAQLNVSCALPIARYPQVTAKVLPPPRLHTALWADRAYPLGTHTALAELAADFLELRKNFLLHSIPDPAAGPTPTPFAWQGFCQPEEDGREGHAAREKRAVLVIRMLSPSKGNAASHCQVSAELLACGDEALLWRRETLAPLVGISASSAPLLALTAQRHGPAAARAALNCAPHLRRLLAELPDPTLSDEEILEKLNPDP